ncbi:MAG: hypothetical protein R3330_05630, partial [Saprospiraceae bacterium]|nr:hypothetical protein [Saprospiraceae bacterium]
RQGYVTFRLSSLGGYQKMEIPYEEYSRMYGIDHWILHADLDYAGREYGFGPSPPDQYALNFALDSIRAEQSPPYALFFISQNSHTPYDTPQDVVDDWRSLRKPTASTNGRSLFWSKPKFADYGKAISYQLRYLIDAVIKQGGPQDIFLLVGDHQPASLSVPIETFHTPVHVIAQDQEFIRSMSTYGFSPGLLIRDTEQVTRHEALYWAFMRSFLGRYGNPQHQLPEYLETGIPYA